MKNSLGTQKWGILTIILLSITIVNLVNIFTEYVNINLWDAGGEFIVHVFA